MSLEIIVQKACHEVSLLSIYNVCFFHFKCTAYIGCVTLSLIPKCKDRIEAKEHAIHNGQGCFDQCQIACTRPKRKLPGLDYKDAAGHEEGAAQNTEEYIDALVYRCAHQYA